MAINTTTSNHFLYQLGLGQINLSSDDLIMILMNDSFTFDKDAHATLSDIADHQLATGNGYTQNNKSLTSLSWVENDTTNKGVFTCDDVTFIASGGSIGPSGAYCIIDASAIEAIELITDAVNRNFTGGSSDWANGDLGTTFDDTTDLSLVSDATGQYCKITFTDIGNALVAGGLYRLQYDYTQSLAGYEFKINGASLQTLGDAVAGTSQTIDFYADESFAGAHELRIYSKTNAAAAADFDNFSLKELGTVVNCVDFDANYTILNTYSQQFQDIDISTTQGS